MLALPWDHACRSRRSMSLPLVLVEIAFEARATAATLVTKIVATWLVVYASMSAFAQQLPARAKATSSLMQRQAGAFAPTTKLLCTRAVLVVAALSLVNIAIIGLIAHLLLARLTPARHQASPPAARPPPLLPPPPPPHTYKLLRSMHTALLVRGYAPTESMVRRWEQFARSCRSSKPRPILFSVSLDVSNRSRVYDLGLLRAVRAAGAITHAYTEAQLTAAFPGLRTLAARYSTLTGRPYRLGRYAIIEPILLWRQWLERRGGSRLSFYWIFEQVRHHTYPARALQKKCRHGVHVCICSLALATVLTRAAS